MNIASTTADADNNTCWQFSKALADALIERCAEDWKEEYVAYVDEIESFVLPMYTEKDLPKGTTAQELAHTAKCPQCGKDIVQMNYTSTK